MIRLDLTNEEYHQHPAVSSSQLRVLATKTPAHFHSAPPRVETDAMKRGTALHCAILEPSEFDQRYMLMPEGLDRRTKEGKELWAEIQASGKIPLASKYFDMTIGVAKSVLSHPFSKEIFQHPLGVAEASIFWVDVITGIECRIRPDFMIQPCPKHPNGLILDFKTTDSAIPEDFQRKSYKMQYHLQAAFYRAGFCAEFGTMPDVYLLAAEFEAPFLCAYYRCTDEFLAGGEFEFDSALNVFSRCKKTGVWPGLSNDIRELNLPDWARDFEEEVEVNYV